MTEINEENIDLQVGESKLTKVLLTIVTMLLIFAGPTYVTWILTDLMGSVGAIVIGFVLFVVGIVMLVFLIRKKIIT
jgi:uncharacterized membrane protein